MRRKGGALPFSFSSGYCPMLLKMLWLCQLLVSCQVPCIVAQQLSLCATWRTLKSVAVWAQSVHLEVCAELLRRFMTGFQAQAFGTFVPHLLVICLFVLMLLCWYGVPVVAKKQEQRTNSDASLTSEF